MNVNQVPMNQLITDNIDIWTSTVKTKATTGRGSSKKLELYGVKKLRELILELAVRGKLVPQDPSDEPASVLLERIAAEKAQLVKEKKIKKPRKYEAIDERSLPFNIPSSWEWARIEDLGHDLGQKKPDQTFTYVDVGSINKELGFIEDPSIMEASEAPSRARKLVKENTVIYSTIRPYLLNIAVIDRNFSPEPIASTAFAIVHPLSGLSSSYIYRYLRSPSFIEYVESVQTGVAYPAINDKQFFYGLIPVPPTEEQIRIVAKVDELMTLCDQLEQQTESSIAAHQVLVTTLLDTLINSANAEELMQNWQMVAEHFDTLLTTEESIDQLKQTILQLAVMGKLVPQDPNDEPAAKLLERIAEEKAQLIKEKKIKKQKALPPITEDEKPFELPNGWEWCRLPDLGELARGKSKHRPRNDPKLYEGGSIPLVQTGDVARANGTIQTYTAKYNEFGLAQSQLWPKGTLCITIAANIADTATLGFDACFPDSVVGYTPYEKEIPTVYFDYFIKTAKENLERFAPSTAQKNINLEILSNVLVPCPPKLQFSRIVEKVDVLLGICDDLKDRLKNSQTTQLHLTDAIVEQAV